MSRAADGIADRETEIKTYDITGMYSHTPDKFKRLFIKLFRFRLSRAHKTVSLLSFLCPAQFPHQRETGGMMSSQIGTKCVILVGPKPCIEEA